MIILFDHPEPALLAQGGMLIQIRQTKAALEALGCQVDYLRWWDETQRADILHYFGRMPPHLLRLAQAKGIKVVLGELLTGPGSRTEWHLWWQRQAIRLLRSLMVGKFTTAFRWESHRLADALVALTSWEAHLLNYLFEAPKEKIHVIPNGVESAFLDSMPATRGRWLVCTGTITERKRVLELAEAAVQAQTPLWIIGKAHFDSDAYAQQVFKLVKTHPQMLRFEGPIADRPKLAQIYRESRGFVLLSSSESLSLSALEAAACECPLLLADLPWARTVFQEHASYCPITRSTQITARVLRQFYDAAPRLPAPPKPLSWIEVAKQVKAVYETLLTPPR
jgi:glycosyltransferase involved in cell wall biosynthesis